MLDALPRLRGARPSDHTDYTDFDPVGARYDHTDYTDFETIDDHYDHNDDSDLDAIDADYVNTAVDRGTLAAAAGDRVQCDSHPPQRLQRTHRDPRTTRLTRSSGADPTPARTPNDYVIRTAAADGRPAAGSALHTLDERARRVCTSPTRGSPTDYVTAFPRDDCLAASRPSAPPTDYVRAPPHLYSFPSAEMLQVTPSHVEGRQIFSKRSLSFEGAAPIDYPVARPARDVMLAGAALAPLPPVECLQDVPAPSARTGAPHIFHGAGATDTDHAPPRWTSHGPGIIPSPFRFWWSKSQFSGTPIIIPGNSITIDTYLHPILLQSAEMTATLDKAFRGINGCAPLVSAATASCNASLSRLKRTTRRNYDLTPTTSWPC